MSPQPRWWAGLLAGLLATFTLCPAREPSTASTNLWDLARERRNVHRFSTLFTASEVSHLLAENEGLEKALAWCKATGVTKVYLETFRDGHQAERPVLVKAKAAFAAADIEVRGCVTTTRVGKPSTGWKEGTCCYTDKATQEKLQAVFEYAASIFDEIMIDDFWFTDCACPECDQARQSRTVTIGEHRYPVAEDTWEAYRCELMVRLSRERLLEPARKVNRKARLIIKYPQWYDNFHNRGYEVVRETAEFDRIWVGTETRNYQDPRWGGTPQYEAYFIMRWLGGIGGARCGGGWFDPYGTTESTYLEQARQTILGGARETVLFAYGSLLRDTGPANVAALRQTLPELLEAARQVRSRRVIGIAAYKPPNSHPEKEARVFDFAGMLGFPLVPCHEFPAKAPAIFLSIHALKDPELVSRLGTFLKSGKPVLLTDSLAKALASRLDLNAPNVHILPVKQDPKSVLEMDAHRLDSLREPLLRPFKATFRAPNRVALYLFKDKSWVIENFNDEKVAVELNGERLEIAARGWHCRWR
jgi:hypothetical protein